MDEELIQVQTEEVVIEVEEGTGWSGGDGTRHSDMPDRYEPDQHIIESITGLREELDAIEKLKTVESDGYGAANYYKWNNGSYDEFGYFVSLVPGTAFIDICSGSDIFGVTVQGAGFIGGQDPDANRDNSYALVATSGIVDVRCESDVSVGDCVVSNSLGVATATDTNCGYKVIARADLLNVPYATISLGVQACTTDLIGKQCLNLANRMTLAEVNVVNHTNKISALELLTDPIERNIDDETLSVYGSTECGNTGVTIGQGISTGPAYVRVVDETFCSGLSYSPTITKTSLINGAKLYPVALFAGALRTMEDMGAQYIPSFANFCVLSDGSLYCQAGSITNLETAMLTASNIKVDALTVNNTATMSSVEVADALTVTGTAILGGWRTGKVPYGCFNSNQFTNALYACAELDGAADDSSIAGDSTTIVLRPSSSATDWAMAVMKKAAGDSYEELFGVKHNGYLYATTAKVADTLAAGTVKTDALKVGTFMVQEDLVTADMISAHYSIGVDYNGYITSLLGDAVVIGYAADDSASWARTTMKYNEVSCQEVNSTVKTSWANIIGAGTEYANSGSDRRIKHDIEELPEAYEVLFDSLEARRYKYNDGTSDRYHTGYIAQDVVAAVEMAGLSTKDFAAVVLHDAGTDKECWYLRRDEFVALNTWQIQKLKARVTELEASVQKLQEELHEKL